jgi:hypothetical protein
MPGNGKRLREALIRSLHEKPLLLSAHDEFLPDEISGTKTELRGKLQTLLDRTGTLGDGDKLVFRHPESEALQKFRDAMRSALSDSSRITASDAELFHELGFEKLSEFRTTLKADLGGPAEIPTQDLAIYVSVDDERVRGFKEAFEQQISVPPDSLAVPVHEKMPPAEKLIDYASSLDMLREQTAPIKDKAHDQQEMPPEIPALTEMPESGVQVEAPEKAEEVEAVSLEIRPPETKRARRKKLSLHDLNPVPRLTAALEAAGIDERDFGFILRYGRYAPAGRRSDFLVGGLGLAELSRRIVAWLEGQAPMRAQVQVVDDGSGELNVYLLAQESIKG